MGILDLVKLRLFKMEKNLEYITNGIKKDIIYINFLDMDFNQDIFVNLLDISSPKIKNINQSYAKRIFKNIFKGFVNGTLKKLSYGILDNNLFTDMKATNDMDKIIKLKK